MVQVDVTYRGGLRCQAAHGLNGQALTTDAPVDSHGKGEYFSPTDLVAAALGACLATVMGIVAEREKIDLSGMRITVLKEMTTAPPRRIARLVSRVSLPAGISETQRAKLEKAAHHCPVHESLRPEIEMPIEFVVREG